MDGDGAPRFKYRICEVQPRQKQFGRPKRTVILAWDDVNADDLATLRRLHDSRLTAHQIAEVDGRIVARGQEVAQADAEESETVEAPAAAPTATSSASSAGPAAPVDPAPPAPEVTSPASPTVPLPTLASVVPAELLRLGSPAAVTEFAHRMCWDIYERDMAASEKLRNQAHELNEKAINQAKQIDQMLAEIVGMRADLLRQQAQQAQQRGVSAQDIKEIMQAGAFIVNNMQGKTPGQP